MYNALSIRCRKTSKWLLSIALAFSLLTFFGFPSTANQTAPAPIELRIAAPNRQKPAISFTKFLRLSDKSYHCNFNNNAAENNSLLVFGLILKTRLDHQKKKNTIIKKLQKVLALQYSPRNNTDTIPPLS